MPAWVDIVIVLVVLVVLALVLGGSRLIARRSEHNAGALEARLDEVNRALALARAQDKGWERATLDAAAREAWEGGPIEALELVQVVDRPGTEQDRAVFRVTTGGRDEQLTLGRRDGAWVREH
jgi:hypothetical protein